MVFVEK